MRGEVWWSERPDAKRRPVLVLTRSVMAHRLPQVTIAEITTHRRGLPTEVEVDEGDGLPRACVVTLDNLQTLRRAYLIDYITTLNQERIDEVCQALRIAVDC
jgi:mRNA interferase MazF